MLKLLRVMEGTSEMFIFNLAEDTERPVLFVDHVQTMTRSAATLSPWGDLLGLCASPCFPQEAHQGVCVCVCVHVLQGLGSSDRSHQESCLFLPIIQDSVHSFQAPGDVGQSIIRCHPGPCHLGSFAYVNIMHCAHFYLLLGAAESKWH